MQHLDMTDAEDVTAEAFAFDFALAHLQRTAYGSRCLHLAGGDSVEVPAAQLDGLVEDITKEYLLEADRRHEVPLCREHFRTILTSLSGGGDQCMAALDSSYFKNCLETFKGLRRLIEIVCWGKSELKEQLMQESHRAEEYLRKEYTHHLRENSPCTMHSFNYAFGGEEGEVQRCALCDSVHIFLENVRRATELCNLPPGDPDSPATLMTYLLKLVENVYAYIGHQVRKQHEKRVDEEVLKELDAETVYVIVDWKMKLLEMAYRQAMSEFFGQRGIAWFGMMVYQLKNDDELAADKTSKYKTSFIDLTMDDGKEDAFAAANMVVCALSQVKARDPSLRQFILKSDGAGCFAGSEFCAALPRMLPSCGLRCTMQLRSEVGLGKTALDSHFARSRLVLHRNVLIGRGAADVHCAEDCARVLSLHGGVAGSASGFVVLNRGAAKSPSGSAKVSGLDGHLQRRFVYDEQGQFVRCELWRMSFRRCGDPDMTVDAVNLTCIAFTATVRMCNPYDTEVPGVREEGASNSQPPQLTALPNVLLDSTERKRSRELRLHRRKAKSVNLRQRVQSQQAVLEGKLQSSGFHRCPKPGCKAVFRSLKRLASHVTGDKHAFSRGDYELAYTYSKRATGARKCWKSRSLPSNGLSTKDTLKLKTARVLETALNEGALVSLTAVTEAAEVDLQPTSAVIWVLFDGTEVVPSDLPSGFAHRSSGTKATFTMRQLDYVLFVQGRGDSQAESPELGKTLPRVAEAGMRLKGTAGGAALFPGEVYMAPTPDGSRVYRCEEWLDSQQLKSLMSKPRKELVKQYNRQVMKEMEANNRHVIKCANKIQIGQLAQQHSYPFVEGEATRLTVLRAWLINLARNRRTAGTPLHFQVV